MFAIGRNDHVYQLAPSLGPAWRDLGPPPSSAPSGTPSFGATRGFIGGLVLGRDRHLYGLWSSEGDRFSWNDHGAPPGTADSLVLIGVGPGYPSLIAGETYVGVLVVSDSGELSELYRTGDGAWNWVSIGPPMGRRNPRVAVSDPSYVGVAMGYRGVFMNGSTVTSTRRPRRAAATTGLGRTTARELGFCEGAMTPVGAGRSVVRHERRVLGSIAPMAGPSPAN